MPNYIISLGSNLSSGEMEVKAAIRWLSDISKPISETPTYTTPDAKDASKPRYTNAIVTICCDLGEEELAKKMKSYEESRGRIHGSAIVQIDLDLVCRDCVILRPRDFSAPYFVKGLYLLSSSGKSKE